jgi:hypothetical protein
MRLRAELCLRELLLEARKAQPDRIQYGDSLIHLFWNTAEVSILVEITDEGEIGMSRCCDPAPATDSYTVVSLDGLRSRLAPR